MNLLSAVFLFSTDKIACLEACKQQKDRKLFYKGKAKGQALLMIFYLSIVKSVTAIIRAKIIARMSLS